MHLIWLSYLKDKKYGSLHHELITSQTSTSFEMIDPSIDFWLTFTCGLNEFDSVCSLINKTSELLHSFCPFFLQQFKMLSCNLQKSKNVNKCCCNNIWIFHYFYKIQPTNKKARTLCTLETVPCMLNNCEIALTSMHLR